MRAEVCPTESEYFRTWKCQVVARAQTAQPTLAMRVQARAKLAVVSWHERQPLGQICRTYRRVESTMPPDWPDLHQTTCALFGLSHFDQRAQG
jgi:hypothetical protein